MKINTSSTTVKRRWLLLPLILVIGLLAACATDRTGTPDTPADSALAATATARAASDASESQPDGAAAPTPAAELTFTAGRNADGTFYRGEADAPVTLIDYSDFL